MRKPCWSDKDSDFQSNVLSTAGSQRVLQAPRAPGYLANTLHSNRYLFNVSLSQYNQAKLVIPQISLLGTMLEQEFMVLTGKLKKTKKFKNIRYSTGGKKDTTKRTPEFKELS